MLAELSSSCLPSDVRAGCIPDTSPGGVHGAKLNALSLDIPGEDGKGPPIYDLQTDFPWAFAPAAPGAEMLERVLRARGPRFSVGGVG